MHSSARFIGVAATLFIAFSVHAKEEVRPAVPVELCNTLLEKPDPLALRIFAEINPRLAATWTAGFATSKAAAIAHRPPELQRQDAAWMKQSDQLLRQIQYMGYVPFIGSGNGTGTYKSLEDMLHTLFDLAGFTMMYNLPTQDSPFMDAGFDVRNFYEIAERFGGMREFLSFIKNLKMRDGKLQMDIILNHVSDQHEWAKKVRAGDSAARRHFHILEEPPRVVKVQMKNGLPMSATYLEKDDNGNDVQIERRVIFPESADPAHPHYVKIKDDQGRSLWVYHTFYPFQWDLNYEDADTLLEAFKITSFWANQGVDVIRLDAIPFLFKNRESDPRTLKVVEAIRYYLSQTAPSVSIIVEACQEPATVYKFFGAGEKIRVDGYNQKLTTTSGGQVAYNFDWMAYTWASLISADKNYMLDVMERTVEPPLGAVWAYFLRLHDELTLEMVPEEIRSVVARLIHENKGVDFRGGLGVGGRTANFLDNDPRRILMAMSILLSQRGLPIVYYGDEIMAQNDSAYAAQAAQERGGKKDGRDAGRGTKDKRDWDAAVSAGATTPQGQVFAGVSRLNHVRKSRESLMVGEKPVQVWTDQKSVPAFTRTIPGKESTLVVANLSDQTMTVKIGLKSSAKELFDVIGERNVDFKSDGQFTYLQIEPFQTFWFAL